MSISQNYPTIAPSLDLSFALTKKLDPRITFARASTATYYDGKTVAKAEENLLLQSELSSGWNITGSGALTTNATTAPNGTNTGASFVPSTSNTAQYISQGVNWSANSFTASVFAKKNGYGWVQLWSSITADIANFDLVNGVLGTVSATASASITDIGNGWYRCSMTITAIAGTQSFRVGVYNSDATRNQSFQGNGTDGIFLWGAQLEQRSSVTAYTPTTTQPITNYIPTLLTAPANVARFEHNPVTGESLGLEVEEQRTNLVLRSDEFDNASWDKFGTVTVNSTIAPDGLASADLITTDGAQAQVFQGITISSGATITGSCYFKQYGLVSPQIVLLSNNNTTPYGRATFNISTGVISVAAEALNGASNASASITPVGNGWYRCSVTVTYPAVTAAGIRIAAAGASGSIFLWGAQLEAGSFPTSYIKTVASQVTRAADSASMVGANFSSWYNVSQGSFYVEATPPSASQIAYVLIANTSIYENSNYIGKFDSGGGGVGKRWVSGTNLGSAPQAVISSGTDIAVAQSKLVYAYKANDFQFTGNGTSFGSDVIGQVPTPTSFWIGSRDGTLNLGGTISKISYYPARLTNTQLQALTS